MKIGIKIENDLICLNKLNPNDTFTILELDDKYSDCQPYDFNKDLTFNIEKYNKRKQNNSNKEKLFELTNWFDNYFDKQLHQSLWQDDFTISHDNYFNKDYANIDELKAQAKIVRNEIRELRNKEGE